MKKRIISLVTAVVSASLSVVPFVPNACYKGGEDNYFLYHYKNSEHYKKVRELEDKYKVLFGCEDDQRLYICGDAGGLLLKEDSYLWYRIYFDLAPNVSKEQVDECLAEIDSAIQSYVPIEANQTHQLVFPFKSYDVKRVMSSFKDKNLLTNVEVQTENRFVDEAYLPAVLSSYDADEISVEEMERFIAENGIDAEISENNDSHKLTTVILNSENNLENCLEFELLVYEKLGIKPFVWDIDNIGGIIERDNEAIEIFDYVDGDANCDGKYTIADSTAILQSLGNPDKYGLSLQGEFNADIYNVGDGVTPMDALEVQKAMTSKG